MAVVPIILATLSLASSSSSAPVAAEAFEQKIPGFLATFKMVPLPDAEVEFAGKKRTIKGLFMSETEVTWDVFDIWAFRLDQSADKPAKGADAASRPSRPYGAPDRGFGHQGYAAIGMTWNAASEFCKWLSAKTGRKYRLPYEWEWEHAATPGADAPIAEIAWHWDNTEDKTMPVKTKKPNPLGLYDLFGNTAEWVVSNDASHAVRGGSYRDKVGVVGFKARATQTPKWNENDPQNPKSLWWLSNAPFVGLRIVCEGT